MFDNGEPELCAPRFSRTGRVDLEETLSQSQQRLAGDPYADNHNKEKEIPP